MGNKWPVVSLPNGAQSASKYIKKAYEWLENFEEIVLMFDMDEPGQKAAKEVADILPPGKVKIARLPLKDANEMLVAGRGEELLKAFWNAPTYRPDGIVTAKDLRSAVLTKDTEESLSYPFEGLNRILLGIRQPELVTITSGSGLGKTTFVREIAYHLHQTHGKQIGMIMLEETNKRTVQGLLGLHMNKNLMMDQDAATPEETAESFDGLFRDRDVILYDHFGSSDVDNILSRIRYMARAMDCSHVFLDHLSILVSGLETSDERKLIDIAMTRLRTLVQETGICLFLVSHLKRPHSDKGHEDGAEVSLGQLRGSHAIAQLSDCVIGLQKPHEDAVSDTTELVVLKNRYTGQRGSAGTIVYNRTTGRLTESVF